MPKATTKKNTKAKKDEEVLEEEETTTEDEESEEEAPEEEESEDSDSDEEAIDILKVKDPSDKKYEDKIYVRQYSLEQHGDDYKALATEFCTKTPKGGGVYIQVPASKLPNKLEVRFREKKDADLHIDKQDPNAPVVDKVLVFSDKIEALRVASQKRDSTVVVSRKK